MESDLRAHTAPPVPAGAQAAQGEAATNIDPYAAQEYLRLLRGYTPALLAYGLKDGFRRLQGAIISTDAQGFSNNTTRLAEEKGEKLAGEEIALALGEADARLLGFATIYGGVLLTAEGDGRRLFFPSLPGEGPAAAARRAVFVAAQFQEAAKSLPQLQFEAGPEDIRFRAGVECTGGEAGGLIITSLGDDYLRNVAVFGEVILRVDTVQHEANPANSEVAVSPAVRRLLHESQFHSAGQGTAFILSSLHENDKPAALHPAHDEEDSQHDIQELTRFYEAHIPIGRRQEMRAAVVAALEEGRPVRYDPPWEYPRVSTAFIEVGGLLQAIGQPGGGADEELHQRINQQITKIIRIVERNSGAVERITGEGVIYAVFEGPSNEYRATRAAFESGQALNRDGFAFRAGVSTDYAFSGVAGVEGQRTFTQIGKRVNESSRLMQSAPENSLVISSRTHRRASHRLRCKELGGLVELKGVGVVDRLLVEKIDYRAGRYAEAERIVGREVEQRRIEELIGLAVKTGKSQILVVEGEAGVGKTAVVSKTIANNLEAGKIYKIDVRSDEANRKLPLSTAKQFLRQLLDIPDELDDPKDLEARILSRELPADINERMSLLNAVLDTAFVQTDRVKWLDRADQREETLKLMQDIFQLKRQSVGREAPVVFADDWQFIDKQSADLLVGFMTETADDGIVWAVPTRPPVNDIEKLIIDGLRHNLPEQTHQLDIKPFPSFEPPPYPGESATDAAKRDYYLKLRNAQIAWFEKNAEWVWPLVCSVFSMDEKELSRNKLAAAKVISRVFSEDVSHGNIFYVREILSHLAMSPDLGVSVFVQHPETGKWHFGDYRLPGETEEYVKANRKYYLTDDIQRELWTKVGGIVDIEKKKFAALDTNAQAVARAMSILGLESSRAMLLKITRIPERRLDMSLDQLLDHGIITDLDGGYFSFVHRITQETIYSNIAKVEEKYAAHEAILVILETDYPNKQEKLSSKFFHSKNSSNLFKIMEYADLYGRQLRSYGEESGAISVLERGSQAFAELERQGFPKMTEQQKQQMVNEQLERLLFIRLIWNRLVQRMDEVATLESAHELFHRYYGGEDGRKEHPVEWAAYHAWILSELGLRVGDKEPERAAKEYYEVALDILKPFEQEGELDKLPEDLQQTIITNLSTAYRRLGVYYRKMAGVDNFNRARKLVERSVHYARMTDDYDTITLAVNGLGIVLSCLCELELANQCYEECLTLAEQTGNLPDQAAYLNNRADVIRGLGDEVGAEAAYMRSFAITDRVFRTLTKARSNVGLGNLKMALGDFPTAMKYFRSAKEFFTNKDVLLESGLSIDLAHCYLRAEQPDTISARAELSSVRSDDKKLNMIGAYITAYADYLDGYISAEEAMMEIERQAKVLLVDGMNNPAMEAYRFLGEVFAEEDAVRSRRFLEQALELSKTCRDGVDEKMIAVQLQSLNAPTPGL